MKNQLLLVSMLMLLLAACQNKHSNPKKDSTVENIHKKIEKACIFY